MNILYIANDRRAAELAAFALGSSTPNLTVAWAASLSGARTWLDEHPGSSILVVEVDGDDSECVTFIGQLRQSGGTTPVIVVSLNSPGTQLSALQATGAQIVVKDGLFLAELPAIVSRAQRAPVGADRRRRVRIGYVGDATLARDCFGRAGGPIEVIEVGRGGDGTIDLSAASQTGATPAFDVLLIEHGCPGVDVYGILKDLSARRVPIPVVLVAEWLEDLAVLASKFGVIDYVVKSKTSFRALVFRLNRLLSPSSRRAIEAKLAETEATRDQISQQRQSSETALATELAKRQTLERQLKDVDGRKHTLEMQLADVRRALADASSARQRADEEHASALAAASAAAKVLNQQLGDAQRALERAEEQHAQERTEAAARLDEHEQRTEARQAQAVATFDATQRKFLEAIAELQRAEQRAAADRQAAAEDAARVRAEFDAELAQETSRKRALETQLADATARLVSAAASTETLEATVAETAARLEDAEAQIVADRQAASEETARIRAAFEGRLAGETSNREAAEQALADATAARQRADDEHASAIALAAAQTAEFQKQADARIALIEAESAAALSAVKQQATAAQQATVEQAARRQLALENELKQEVRRREGLEDELAEMRVAIQDAERRFVEEAAAMRQQAREHETRLEERAARERGEWDRQLTLARETVAARDEQIVRMERAHDEERASLESARAALTADLSRVSNDLTVEHAKLDAAIASHAAEVRELSARQRAQEEAASRTLAGVEQRLTATLTEQERDRRLIAQLQSQAAALDEELQTTKTRRDALKAEADWVPQLRKQLSDAQTEHRRQFDRAPLGMCICRRDGVVTDVNQALVTLLDYDTPEELLEGDVAATVCASADELRSIVERSSALASLESTDPTETTWTKKDGSRIIVRLRALPVASDAVALFVEDVTPYRELEERLHHAQRMEAVARYTSEVAATCDKLLAAIKLEAERWLAASDNDGTRRHGQWLLDEVTRTAGFVRQLGVCGEEQQKAPEIVNVDKMLRDMQPVLKRVAGGDIKVVMPKASKGLNVDVEPDRFARILVNLAVYGRGRMADGDRLIVDVSPVVLDRTFVNQYPNVRSGAHVLLTVTEERRELRSLSVTGVADEPRENPGIDLSTLQALISDCGGHLWIMTEPSGCMMLKIHLPRRPLDDSVSTLPAKRTTAGRWLHRLSGVSL